MPIRFKIKGYCQSTISHYYSTLYMESCVKDSSINLEMGRGGPVFPAPQALGDGGAAQWTRPLPVKPQTQTVLTEHVLQGDKKPI